MDIFRTYVNFIRVNVTSYDEVNIIQNVIITFNSYLYSLDLLLILCLSVLESTAER